MITLDDVFFEKDIVNFALLANCDPIVYEKAAYDDHCVKVIEEEIHAIKKNST